MKGKVFIAIAGTILMVSGWTLAGLCEETGNVGLSLIYGAFLDDYVEKCEARAKWLESGSHNLRKTAMRAAAKGAYFQANRNSLIKHLIVKIVPLSPHHIEYNLNQKFVESVQPHDEVYTAMVNEHGGQ